MVKVHINYEGELHCAATHAPSGNVLVTDAPVDNNGRGEAFSPTDLVATALGTCMATVMGIVADDKGVSLAGMQIEVEKHMASNLPRRIAKLEVCIKIPLCDDHPERSTLEKAVYSCPVHQSLHSTIEIPIFWEWLKS